MKVKKILAGAMAVVLALGMTSCGSKAPTAESLMKGIQELDAGKYYQMEVALSAKQENADGSFDIDAKAKVEGAGDIFHLYDTDLSVGMSGFSMDMDIEMWAELDGGDAYLKGNILGQDINWMKSSMGDSSFGPEDIEKIANSIKDADTEKHEFILQKHEKGEDYIVEMVIDGDDISDAFGDAMETMKMDGDSGFNAEDCKAEVRFDEETKDLKTIFIKGEGDEMSFSLEITFLAKNGNKKLEIPKDVIKTAEEAENNPDANNGWSFSLGDDEGGDNHQQPGGEIGNTTTPGNGTYVDTEKYRNDGEAYDEVIDPMAEAVYAADPNLTYLSVSHYTYTGVSRMSYSTSGDDWGGEIVVERYYDQDEYSNPKDSYERQYNFLHEWYETEPVGGGKDQKFAIFATDDYGQKAEIVCYTDEYYLTGEARLYNDGANVKQALNKINDMFATAGIEGVFDASALS